MKRFLFAASLIVFLTLALSNAVYNAVYAQHQHPSSSSEPAKLVSGLSNLHHPVSTKNAEAQKFFDQGLALIYGFNHKEARRSFERAVRLDPTLAMAYWGMAPAVGPNYNEAEIDPSGLLAADRVLEKAKEMASNASEKVFCKDLEDNPHNGRSLFGLAKSLKKQGNSQLAETAQREFETVWKNATTKLKIEDL